MIFTLLNPSRKEKTLKEERKRNGEKLKTMEILLYTERERREIVEVDERFPYEQAWFHTFSQFK
jgi:hypothetical protein